MKLLNALAICCAVLLSSLVQAQICTQIKSCSELQGFYSGSNVSGCTEVDIGVADCRIPSVADSTTQPSFKRTFKKFKAGTITFGSERFFARPFIHPTVIEELDVKGLQVENNPFGNRGSLTLVNGKIGRLRVAYANVLPLNLGSGVIVSEATGLEKMQIVRSLRNSSQLVGVDLSESLLTLAPSSIKDSDLSGVLLAEGLDFSSSNLDGTNLTGIRFWNAAAADGKSFQDFSSDISLIKWPSNLSPLALGVMAAGTSQVITQEKLQNLLNVSAAVLKNRTFDRNISFANFDVSRWNLAGSDLRGARFENAKGVLNLAKSGMLQGARLTGARFCAQDLQVLFSTLKVSNQTLNLFQAEPITCGSSTVTQMAVNNLSASKIGTAIADARRLGNIDELKGLVEKVWSLGLGPKVLANLQGSNHVEAFLMEFSRYWKPIDLVGARQLSDDLCVAYDNTNAQERAFILALVSWHGVGHAALADIAQALRKNPALADHGFYPADGATCASYQAKNWSSSLFLRQRAILDFWSKTPQSYPELVTAASHSTFSANFYMFAFQTCGKSIGCSFDWRKRLDYLRLDPLLEIQTYFEWLLALAPSRDDSLNSELRTTNMRDRYLTLSQAFESIDGVKLSEVMSMVPSLNLGNVAEKGFIEPIVPPSVLPVTDGFARESLLAAAILNQSLSNQDRRDQLTRIAAATLGSEWMAPSSDSDSTIARMPLPFIEYIHTVLGLAVPFRAVVRTRIKADVFDPNICNTNYVTAIYDFYNSRIQAIWSGIPSENLRTRLFTQVESMKNVKSAMSNFADIFSNELALTNILADPELLTASLGSLQPSMGGFMMPLNPGGSLVRDNEATQDTFFYSLAYDTAQKSTYDEIIAVKDELSLSVAIPSWILFPGLGDSLESQLIKISSAGVWMGFSDPNVAHLIPPMLITKEQALRVAFISTHDFDSRVQRVNLIGRNSANFSKFFDQNGWRLSYGTSIEASGINPSLFSTDFEAIRKGSLLGQRVKYVDFMKQINQDLNKSSSTGIKP